MPRGFGGVRQASAESQQRRNSGGPNALWFRISAGQETVARFLEQDEDIFWAMMHEVPVEGRSWGKDVPCLDQDGEGSPCPGCERNLPRKFKGFINLIWHDAPVFKRDEQNKMVKDSNNKPIVTGTQPQVAIWSSGIRLFENLDEINANYKGLTSRRFKVKRKGEGLSTAYSINPEDIDSGKQDFSDKEKSLAAEKYDLAEFTKPGSYDEFLKELGEGGGSSGSGGSQEQPRSNPFMRN